MRVHGIARLAGKVLLGLGSIAIALVASELVLRLFPHPRGHFVIVPGSDWTTTAAPDVIPGISGVNHYRVNRWGVRGRPFGNDSAEYRVLAVGGSTTECVSLDDDEVWTRLLEASLARTADGRAAWVGNVGRSGMTTRDNALHIKYLLKQYPRVDVVVALVGANDLQLALQQGWKYQQPGPISDLAEERVRLPRAFPYVAGRTEQSGPGEPGSVPAYKATEIWQLGRRAHFALAAVRNFDLALGGRNVGLFDARSRRQGTKRWIDSLPPLEAALAEYRSNLNAMVDYAAAAGARMVFVTQPTLWGDDLPEDLSRLLWSGWWGTFMAPEAYFTAGALRRGMAVYNGALLGVCRDRQVECADAAGVLSHDRTAFYDDMHFTELGAQKLARILGDHFGERAPFRPAPRLLPPGPGIPTIRRSRPQPFPL